MQTKTYRARDTYEAYRSIKSDLGEDALILQVRQVRDGGVRGLFGAGGVEVLAATDEPARMGGGETAAGLPDPRLDTLQAGLCELRRQVADLSGRLTTGMLLPEALQRPFERLIDAGVESALAQRLLAAVQADLDPSGWGDEAALWEAVRHRAATLVGVRPPLGARPPRTRVVFLLGPTGAGKTTTIAKLGAQLALAHRRRVALITVDTFRVGAIAQLQTFADLLGIPLHVAYDPDELADRVARLDDQDYLLVDTPGLSPYCAALLGELRDLLQAVEPREVLLAVPLSTVPSELREIVGRFEVVPVDGLVVTKVDEVRTAGNLLGLVESLDLPIAYLTTGQNVPQDIECATPGGVIAWALGRNDAR